MLLCRTVAEGLLRYPPAPVLNLLLLRSPLPSGELRAVFTIPLPKEPANKVGGAVYRAVTLQLLMMPLVWWPIPGGQSPGTGDGHCSPMQHALPHSLPARSGGVCPGGLHLRHWRDDAGRQARPRHRQPRG